jgi:uncharacterized protein (TIGR02597 family)
MLFLSWKSREIIYSKSPELFISKPPKNHLIQIINPLFMTTMKLRPPRFLGSLVLSLAAAITAHAQTTVTTDPVGFTTLSATSAPSSSVPSYTFMSLDLTRPVDYAGLIPASGVSSSGSAGSLLTFPAGTFTGLALSGTGNSHYIEVTNGSGAGAMSAIVASDNDHTITLADDLSAIIDNAGGTTTFKTRPHWTFGTAFGVNNSAGFLSGSTASTADLIQVLNPNTGAISSYFYNSKPTVNHWQTGISDATNIIIPPDFGLLIVHKPTSPVTFTLQGSVKLGPTGIFVHGGNATKNTVSIVNNPYPLNSVTLGNSGLYTGSTSTGLLSGSTASTSDLVSFINPNTGALSSYFYNSKPSVNHWQTGISDATNTVIPDGTAVMITRRIGGSSFTWYVPQPTMVLQ